MATSGPGILLSLEVTPRVRTFLATKPHHRTFLAVKPSSATLRTYQKRVSERLAPLEVDLARLQQGLPVRKAKFETDIEHHEKLKSQLLERFPRNGGLDAAQGQEELRLFREWHK